MDTSLTFTDREWENQSIQQINRVPMHVPLNAYATREEALCVDENASSNRTVLDGEWAFQLFPSPSSVPADFFKGDFDHGNWGTIRVPGSWELQGHGHPIYTNILYPFNNRTSSRHLLQASEEGKPQLNPPYIPEDNPTGCYLKDFRYDNVGGKTVYLSFGAVESAFYVWLNGQAVGYSQDSKLPAEFDITRYLKKGANRLAVKVMRFSVGSYLEDQDYWYLSGIHRSVALYAKPKVHIFDYQVQTRFDSSYRDADLIVYCGTSRYPGYADHQVQMELFDQEKNRILSKKSPVLPQVSMYGRGPVIEKSHSALLTGHVVSPRKWDSDSPYLYTLVLTLLDPQGNAVDYESCAVGFRQVEINAEGILTLNGKRLVIRGVNRHEHHPTLGRSLPKEWMEKEIVTMKRLNFNAVRTSHYPNSHLFYELCDRYGIYVVDEANLETHGLDDTLSLDPEWANAYLERAKRMVLRDKNHPCVLIWSLGNESCAGMNHAAMAGWVRGYDGTRPIQYESWDAGPLITDIRAPMYPSLEWVESELTRPDDRRPFVMCEYAYSKSNSNGNLDEYWDRINRYPRFQGGFVWDFQDKAITVRNGNQEYWGYGGDFGEDVVDPVKDMCINGVVQPDLTPHPGAYEIKHVQAPVTIKELESDQGSFLVYNRYISSDLSRLKISWELLKNGRTVQSGNCPSFATPPGGCDRLAVPYDAGQLHPGDEYFLNLHFTLAKDCSWAKAGHEIVSFQRCIQQADFTPISLPAPAAEMRCEETGETIRLASPSLSLTFSKTKGMITRYEINGKPVMLRGFEENFYRAPTGIDKSCGEEGRSVSREWEKWGLHELSRHVEHVETQTTGKKARIAVGCTLSGRGVPLFHSVIAYTVYSGGIISVDCKIDAGKRLPMLPRIGVKAILPQGCTDFQWYGRGPQENYPDRKLSAPIGCYRSTVHEQYYPYIVPVECGGKEEVRWFSLTDSEREGVVVIAHSPLHIDVHHNTVEDYAKARHTVDLIERKEVYVNIDCVHSGLGGNSGWDKTIGPKYQVHGGRYQFGFTVFPAESSDPVSVFDLYRNHGYDSSTKKEKSMTDREEAR